MLSESRAGTSIVKSIRCGRGLGDSIYLQSVVRHLLAKGARLRVKSDYPEVFRSLPVEVVPFSRTSDMTAHYSARKGVEGTTQFEDCCRAAGISEPVEMRLDWTAGNQALVDRVLAHGKPVAVVSLPRSPMGRSDGFGAELLPDCRVIQEHIDALAKTHTIVQVGAGEPLYRFKRISIDLANRTTVGELIDVASVADRFLGYCSFLVPLAESFHKPALFVWSHKGLHSRHLYVRRITPQKVLHRKDTSRWVLDSIKEPAVRFVDEADVRKVFAGKRVAIVGSGPGLLANRPGFVDAHDVVVRVNNYKTLNDRTGRRTDVFYSFFGVSIKKKPEELIADGVRLCMCKCPDGKFIESEWHRKSGRMNGVDFSGIYAARNGWWFCDTYIPSVEHFLANFNLLGRHVPTTGFSAILDVLSMEPKSVYLTGFDFFESKVHNLNEPWRRKNPDDPIGHVPEVERRWLAHNLSRYPIEMDDTLAAALDTRAAA